MTFLQSDCCQVHYWLKWRYRSDLVSWLDFFTLSLRWLNPIFCNDFGCSIDFFCRDFSSHSYFNSVLIILCCGWLWGWQIFQHAVLCCEGTFIFAIWIKFCILITTDLYFFAQVLSVFVGCKGRNFLVTVYWLVRSLYNKGRGRNREMDDFPTGLTIKYHHGCCHVFQQNANTAFCFYSETVSYSGFFAIISERIYVIF